MEIGKGLLDPVLLACAIFSKIVKGDETMKKSILILSASVLFVINVAYAGNMPDTSTIPGPLVPWKAWVLHGEEKHFCPVPYNDPDEYLCVWPSRIELGLSRSGGYFSQRLLVFTEGWNYLPGGNGQWPRDVYVDGKKTAVVLRNKRPCIKIGPGRHVIKGRFVWHRLPDMMQIPASSGLLTLYVNGKRIDFPVRDQDGHLWVKKRHQKTSREDRVSIHICRLIKDTIPMQIITRFRIDVSGHPREIKASGAVLEGFVPLFVKSPVPAGIGPGNTLVVQAGPGQWQINVASRSKDKVRKISLVNAPYGEEIWAFESHNELRMVQVKGAPSIDPSRADIPGEWRRFPTFIVRQGTSVVFQEIRRGDPDPGHDSLRLARTWWLDFDGNGYTVLDRIGVIGTMKRDWRLAMNPPFVLGRVTIDGRDQLITEYAGKPGVEIRDGRFNMTAVSRYDRMSLTDMPVAGWDHDFVKVSSVLNLPPGWRLFAASGVDVLPGTWLSLWTLFDLFLVMIISLSVFRLWGFKWGILALVTLILIYQEPGAPHFVWLSIVLAVALLRVLPNGWMKRFVHLWAIASLLILVLMSIPFIVHQVRWGIYPQLEPRQVWSNRSGHAGSGAVTELLKETSVMQGRKQGLLKSRYLKDRIRSMSSSDKSYLSKNKSAYKLVEHDPNALIQTGPGVPEWRWHSYSMRWNGPVEKGQRMHIVLFPPVVNLVLALIRVMFLVLLILKMASFIKWKKPGKTFSFAAWLMVGILLSSHVVRARTVDGAFPPKYIIEELKNRLLERPDCFPHCADSPYVNIRLHPESITMTIGIDAEIDTAVPLPGPLKTWAPANVIMDGKPARGIMQYGDGYLWAFVPKGIHVFELEGPIPSVDSVYLHFKLSPHAVTYKGYGWKVEGIGKDGTVKGGIKILRTGKSLKGHNEGIKQTPFIALPPFLHVRRVISLSLDWHVTTTVRRVTPLGTPVVVSIPLIHGESVTTAGLDVERGHVNINMGPMTREVRWKSTLRPVSTITLKAPTNVPWTETWIMDISPIWHCTFRGIPVIHRQDGIGRFRPEWKPWPGESVVLSVSKPEAIQGQYLTVDHVDLTMSYGQRLDRLDMSMKLRSSKGGEHRIILPTGARIQEVKINGRLLPVSEHKTSFMVPLRPGKSTVNVKWLHRSDSVVLKHGPAVHTGSNAVNVNISFKMPENRWILWTHGPVMGPVVLFWSLLVVVVLAAFVLGRISMTPLKTWQWVLLGLGLTQVNPIVALIVAGWLVVLGLRAKGIYPGSPFLFDLGQVALVLWTAVAFAGLYAAVQHGLLGIPDMQIAGNGSSGFILHWTQDRIEDIVPQPWVISVPLSVFRFLMLLWSLWLAHSLVSWMRWAWQSFSKDCIWKPLGIRKVEQ